MARRQKTGKRGRPRGARSRVITGVDGSKWRTPFFRAGKWRVTIRRPDGTGKELTLTRAWNAAEALDEVSRLSHLPPPRSQPPAVRLRDALTQWADTLGGRRASTLKNYGTTINALVEALGPTRPVRSIRVGDLELLKNKVWSGKKVTTVQQHFVKLKKFFRWAVNHDMLDESPFNRLDLMRGWAKVQPVGKSITDDQARALLAACRDPYVIQATTVFGGSGRATRRPVRDLWFLVLAALRSGLRQGNLVGPSSWRWSDVNLVEGTVSIDGTRTKNKNDLFLPLHRDVLAALRDRLQALGRIPDPKEPVISDQEFTAALRVPFERAVRRAGLAPLRFHDTRHGFATTLAALVPFVHLQRLLHHQKATVTEGYTHLGIEALRAELEKLPSLIGTVGKKIELGGELG